MKFGENKMNNGNFIISRWNSYNADLALIPEDASALFDIYRDKTNILVFIDREDLESNDNFSCDTQGNPPYTLGEQLNCETLETEFDICYPSDCESVKLADFEDKIIFIIYEEDW